ncbi:hypothetical protein GCM10010289_81830 [Streptomyces violascens]|nr:hypothetical protein GCM10010289_81830 [Streptomyces violascens]
MDSSTRAEWAVEVFFHDACNASTAPPDAASGRAAACDDEAGDASLPPLPPLQAPAPANTAATDTAIPTRRIDPTRIKSPSTPHGTLPSLRTQNVQQPTNTA